MARKERAYIVRTGIYRVFEESEFGGDNDQELVFCTSLGEGAWLASSSEINKRTCRARIQDGRSVGSCGAKEHIVVTFSEARNCALLTDEDQAIVLQLTELLKPKHASGPGPRLLRKVS